MFCVSVQIFCCGDVSARLASFIAQCDVWLFTLRPFFQERVSRFTDIDDAMRQMASPLEIGAAFVFPHA